MLQNCTETFLGMWIVCRVRLLNIKTMPLLSLSSGIWQKVPWQSWRSSFLQRNLTSSAWASDGSAGRCCIFLSHWIPCFVEEIETTSNARRGTRKLLFPSHVCPDLILHSGSTIRCQWLHSQFLPKYCTKYTFPLNGWGYTSSWRHASAFWRVRDWARQCTVIEPSTYLRTARGVEWTCVQRTFIYHSFCKTPHLYLN